MREIKFRTWDVKEKKLRYLDNADCDGYTLGFTTQGYIDIGVCNTGELSKWIWEKYVIQQFTGLKDKNGREVYEGDILKDKQGLIWEVYFNSDYARFDIKSPKLKMSNYNTQLYEQNYLEVVGNIYENPELLKE